MRYSSSSLTTTGDETGTVADASFRPVSGVEYLQIHLGVGAEVLDDQEGEDARPAGADRHRSGVRIVTVSRDDPCDRWATTRSGEDPYPHFVL